MTFLHSSAERSAGLRRLGTVACLGVCLVGPQKHGFSSHTASVRKRVLQATVVDTLHWSILMTDTSARHAIANATVKTLGADGVWHTARTDADGRVVVIVPRRGRATVEAPGFRPSRIEWPAPMGTCCIG